MSEKETTDLTVEDIVSEAGQVKYVTILEVWRSVLNNVDTAKDEHISIAHAVRVRSSYDGLTFQAIPDYYERFCKILSEARDIVVHEIESDSECLNMASAEEDAEHNAFHYKNIIFNWQRLIRMYELEWTCTDVDAAAHVAGLGEANRMIFDQTGIASLLDQIEFRLTEDDMAELVRELEELSEAK